MTDEVYIREPGVEDCEHLEVCEHACRMWCRAYKPRVDRDALLKLADEMEQETGSVCGVCMGKSARRIRKALGVDDA